MTDYGHAPTPEEIPAGLQEQYPDMDSFGSRERWVGGESAWYEYHCWRDHQSCDAELWYRDHQRVTVISLGDGEGCRMLLAGESREERQREALPACYRVQFADGHIGTAMEDELLADPVFFTPGIGPPPADEIHQARIERLEGAQFLEIPEFLRR